MIHTFIVCHDSTWVLTHGHTCWKKVPSICLQSVTISLYANYPAHLLNLAKNLTSKFTPIFLLINIQVHSVFAKWSTPIDTLYFLHAELKICVLKKNSIQINWLTFQKLIYSPKRESQKSLTPKNEGLNGTSRIREKIKIMSK